MLGEVQLLRSVNQYIDVKGNIYEIDANGNIDDMTETRLGNLISAPLDWWNTLSSYDLKIADIIFGGIADGKS